MKRRRQFEIFSMSFLDAICCGFGAIILLFIVFAHERARRGSSRASAISKGSSRSIEQELNDIVGETEIVRRNEATTASDLRTDRERIEDLQAQLERIRMQVLATTEDTELDDTRCSSGWRPRSRP